MRDRVSGELREINMSTMDIARFDDEEPSLRTKVHFLRQTAVYPEPTQHVDTIETHMSWVFLTDRFAYKLKKPVRLPFLDFSTVERRRHFCFEEIRLNQRLAPRIYIGVVPLIAERDGALSLGGTGGAVDWLVKMHRVSIDCMLDHAIRHDRLRDQDLHALADCLIDFYRAAPAIDLTPREYRQRFESAVGENWEVLRQARDILPESRVADIHRRQLAFIDASPWLLEERAAARRIVEAHGDLRPEHVMLGADPQIIDCLEFHTPFRVLDPLDELTFLGMECELLGAVQIGSLVLGRYCRALEDDPAPQLLDFYGCYRASVKLKLAYWHLVDPSVRDTARWPPIARRYLEFAERRKRGLSTS